MSDLCMYELEDNVWDEFDQTGDHIVPHPNNKHGSEPAFEGDSCKKPRREVIGDPSDAGDWCTSKYVSQGKEERGCKPLKNMLEKDSLSHTPEGVFRASCDSDSNKEATGLADSVGSDFCADDSIMGTRCAPVDSNSYHEYPLGDISQNDNDLSFFGNDHVDKESNDLSYYEWPDIGNFEDVDRMFRSCDSTFGLGSIGNEDDMSWFSSTHTVEGSEDLLKEDLLKSDVKFSCLESSPLKNLPEQHEPPTLNYASASVDDSNSASISCKSDFLASKGGESDALGHFTFTNGSDGISESKYGFAPKEQINFHKKQAKHHNQGEGKKKDQRLQNGGSFHQAGNLQKKNTGPDYFGYLQTHIPFMHLDYMHPSNKSSTRSGIKFESSGLTSPSPKESYYASNQVQSMERAHDLSFEAPAMTVDVRREKLQRRQGFRSSCRSKPKDLDMAVQTASYDPISVPKRVHHSQNEVENHGDVESVSIRIPADLDSSNIRESSCMSSGLEDFSLEASSFRQLQEVVEQLDTRTKLRIRDSLYRLARSAEQRHRNASLNGGSIDNRDTSGAFMAEESNNGFMDIETDTNPIDRSIAHLLFHRPSDSSAMAAHVGSSLKSRTVIHGSFTSPPGWSEKLICQEETPGEADKEVVDQR